MAFMSKSIKMAKCINWLFWLAPIIGMFLSIGYQLLSFLIAKQVMGEHSEQICFLFMAGFFRYEIILVVLTYLAMLLADRFPNVFFKLFLLVLLWIPFLYYYNIFSRAISIKAIIVIYVFVCQFLYFAPLIATAIVRSSCVYKKSLVKNIEKRSDYEKE